METGGEPEVESLSEVFFIERNVELKMSGFVVLSYKALFEELRYLYINPPKLVSG